MPPPPEAEQRMPPSVVLLLVYLGLNVGLGTWQLAIGMITISRLDPSSGIVMAFARNWLVSAVFIVGYLFAAVFLWARMNWARYVAIVMVGVKITLGLFALGASGTLLPTATAELALALIALWLVFRPSARAWCGPRTRRHPSPPPPPEH